MAHRIWQVDAFSDQAFAGNPAAVCLLDAPAQGQWMQHLATELGLSDTAFLIPAPEGFELRWFTPVSEMDLCGHATLASAHVLWKEGLLEPTQAARFHTRSGLLLARQLDGGWIELDFPLEPVHEVDAPAGLAQALGGEPRFVGRNRMDLLVELASERQVRELSPDLTALALLDCRGVIVTSQAASAGIDFVSRFFAPAQGIPEDPVTGSAHCGLGPYWAARLGKTELQALQVSPRGGRLRVRVGEQRAYIAGQAVTIYRGAMA